MTDGICHGGADSDGSEIHDDIGETEHRLREGFGKAEHGLAKPFGDFEEGDAEENSEDGDLQDLVFGDGFGDVFGENVKEEIVPLERRDILHGGLGRSGGESETDSGAAEVDDGDTEEESDGGEDFEVDETLPAYAADFAHVTMTCDAGDERTEDKRSDDNFDEAEKDIAEDAQVRGEVGPIEAKFEAEEHGEENPVGKGAFVQASVGKDSERGPAQGGDPRVCEKKGQEEGTQGEEGETGDQGKAESFGRVARQGIPQIGVKNLV